MLLVVLGGDPAGLEGRQRGESGGTSPDGKLTVGAGVNSDLGASRGQVDDLLLQAVSEALVHGGATRKDHILGEILSNVNV